MKQLFKNKRTDMLIGKYGILLISILLTLYATVDALYTILFDGQTWHIILNGVFDGLIIYLSYSYMLSFLKRNKMIKFNISFFLLLITFTVLWSYKLITSFMVEVDFYKSEYFNNFYIITTLISYAVIIVVLIYFRKLIEFDKKLFPAYTKYVAIQNIKIERENNLKLEITDYEY